VKKKHALVLFLLPAVAYIGGVLIYPAIFAGKTSLFKYNFAMPYAMRFVGLANYLNLLRDELFLTSLRNSLFFVVCAVGIEFALGLGIATLLNAELKGRNIIMGLLLIPTIIAPVVVGVVWRFMYNEQFGIIAYFLRKSVFLSASGAILGSPTIAMQGIIATDIWEWTPFMTVILLSGLTALPSQPFEAAKVDGASPWQIFHHVTLPLLRPVIIIALLLRMAEAIKVFDIIFMLTKGGPGHSTETINLYAYRVNFRYFNMGYGSALVIFLLFLTLAFFFLIFSFSRTEM